MRLALPALVIAIVVAGMAVQTRRQIGRWTTSEALGAHMVALAPKAPEPRIQYGTALANAGRVDEGIEQFKKVLELRDFDPAAKYNLAILYAREKRIDDAIATYQRALRDADRLAFCPDTPNILNNLGALLMNTDRDAEARKYLERALKIRPNFPAVRENLARLLNKGGTDSAAFEQAVAANADDADARLKLADALIRNNAFDQAEVHVQRALALKPDEPKVRLMLGRLRRKQGKREEALRCYQDVIRATPNAVDAHVGAAVVLGEMGRFEAALAEYAEVVRLQPNHVDARSDMGLMCVRLGRWKEAIDHYREALRLDPGNPKRRFTLAFALVESGRSDEAVPEFRALLATNPSDVLVRLNLSNALIQAKRYAEAEQELRAVIQAKPNDFNGHMGLATLFEQTGRTAEAIALYKEALRLKPDLAPAAEAIQRLEARRSP